MADPLVPPVVHTILFGTAGLVRAAAEGVENIPGTSDAVSRAVLSIGDSTARTMSSASMLAGEISDNRVAQILGRCVGPGIAAYSSYHDASERGVSQSARIVDSAAAAGISASGWMSWQGVGVVENMTGLRATIGAQAGTIDMVAGITISAAQHVFPSARDELQVVADALPSHFVRSTATAAIDQADAAIRGDRAALVHTNHQIIAGEYGTVLQGIGFLGVALAGERARDHLADEASSGALGRLAQYGASLGERFLEWQNPQLREVTHERGVHVDNAGAQTQPAPPEPPGFVPASGVPGQAPDPGGANISPAPTEPPGPPEPPGFVPASGVPGQAPDPGGANISPAPTEPPGPPEPPGFVPASGVPGQAPDPPPPSPDPPAASPAASTTSDYDVDGG